MWSHDKQEEPSQLSATGVLVSHDPTAPAPDRPNNHNASVTNHVNRDTSKLYLETSNNEFVENSIYVTFTVYYSSNSRSNQLPYTSFQQQVRTAFKANACLEERFKCVALARERIHDVRTCSQYVLM